VSLDSQAVYIALATRLIDQPRGLEVVALDGLKVLRDTLTRPDPRNRYATHVSLQTS
jgi:hypothetical protein